MDLLLFITEQAALFFSLTVSFLVLLGIFALAKLTPQKVVQVRLDPPDSAAYLQLTPPDEDIPIDKREQIRAHKQTIILWHVLNHNDGYCTVRPMKKIMNEVWNKQFKQWPQYKKWRVAQDLVRDTMKEMDYRQGGGVLRVDGQDYIMVHVPIRGQKEGTRKLVLLDELVDLYHDVIHGNEITLAEDQEVFQPPVLQSESVDSE